VKINRIHREKPMKTLTTLMGILLTGSLALAQDTGSATDPYGSGSASGKSSASERTDSSQTLKHKGKVAAEVIATDETAKTITLRPAASSSASSSESVTLPVEGKAVASLKSVKSGEQVSVTCREQAASASGGSMGMGTGSSSTGAEVGGKAGSAAGSAAGVGSSAGSAAGAAAGRSVESALSAQNCDAVTEISKVKASTQPQSDSPSSGH
jgi:hypothetical protein